MPLTPAQKRVLILLDKQYTYQWVSLLELDRTKLLEEDDVLVVPSLIDLGLLWNLRALQAVCLSPTGRTLAGELHGAESKRVAKPPPGII